MSWRAASLRTTCRRPAWPPPPAARRRCSASRCRTTSSAGFANRVRRQPIDVLGAKHRPQDDFADIPASPQAQASFEGKLHSLPFQTNTPLFFDRKDLFGNHGSAVPRTVEEVITAATTLKLRLILLKPGGTLVTARVDKSHRRAAGETVGLAIDPSRLYLFNQARGLRIRLGE